MISIAAFPLAVAGFVAALSKLRQSPMLLSGFGGFVVVKGGSQM